LNYDDIVRRTTYEEGRDTNNGNGPDALVARCASTALSAEALCIGLGDPMHRDGIALTAVRTLTACPPPTSRLGYTPVEVAGLIGKHPKTVREWCRRGVLPSRRLAGAFYISPRALASLLGEESEP
jgi:hypothetical protein